VAISSENTDTYEKEERGELLKSPTDKFTEPGIPNFKVEARFL
jgi:hypothetical protein